MAVQTTSEHGAPNDAAEISVRVRIVDRNLAKASAQKALNPNEKYKTTVPFNVLFGAMRRIWEQTPDKRKAAVLGEAQTAYFPTE